MRSWITVNKNTLVFKFKYFFDITKAFKIMFDDKLMYLRIYILKNVVIPKH